MNNENPENDLPENDGNDIQHPHDQADEGDVGEIADEAGFDDVFEIGISIHETLANPSDGNPAPPLHTDPSDLHTTAAALNAEPLLEAISPETSPTSSLSADLTAPEVFPAPSAEHSDQNLHQSPLEAIKLQMEELAQAFDTKLKYDEHKNKIIDDLHQSLQQHREGLLKKYLHRIVMDVIKVVDDMRKLTAHYNQQPHSEETSVKLLKYIEHIAGDLEDMFSWEGVVPFTCDGDAIDPARQRVLNKIKTDDPEKDKTIAERLRPGYEWDGKIIRPEMVSVYIYQTNSPSGD
jgi:molecular chaperone GrpE (heat shock protein)